LRVKCYNQDSLSYVLMYFIEKVYKQL